MAPIRPYAEEHAALNGPGDQRPTAEQVINDQELAGGLKGVNVLITGCTSGIGIETARALYLTGANIWITARDTTKGNAIAAELSTDADRPVKVINMSLDSFASIRAAAQTYLSQSSTLNILINNAGVMATPEGHTVDVLELQFGTNHLGHFLLFQLLKPALLKAAPSERPSRVVAVSSTGVAYGNSKLSNIYFANELTRRYRAQNLHALSLHPGSIKTPLQKHMAGTAQFDAVMVNPQYQAQTKSIEQGAATTVWAAIGKEWDHRGGVYLEDVGEAGPVEKEGAPWRTGYSEAAYKPEDEKSLWKLSERLCGTIAK